MIWYIGPESHTYHTHLECPRLNNSYRYWPIHKAMTPPTDRRKCKVCERRDDVAK